MEALRAVAKAAAEQIETHVQQGDDICKELRPVHIDHAMAHVLMKLLPVGTVGMHIHSIQEQPLVDQGSWRKTVGHLYMPMCLCYPSVLSNGTVSMTCSRLPAGATSENWTGPARLPLWMRLQMALGYTRSFWTAMR